MSIQEKNFPVAENIKRLIAATGMKQYVIAQRIGCTAQELTDMIYGRRVIKASDIPKIGAALGVGIGELFSTDTERTA